MTITIEKTTTQKQKPADQTKLGFGRIFTDHIFIMNYDAGQGWHDPRILPFAPLKISPAAMCLHYAQEVFEGMKAYRAADGRVLLFRPEKNIARLNTSGARVCIPAIDETLALEAVKALVGLDRDWIPTAPGASLYIRPFIFAVDEQLGVHPGEHMLFVIILSPVGSYYGGGLAPVKIKIENTYVRAVSGGTGQAKTGGNYAASLKAQEVAQKESYSQVLWLDGVERKYIEEVGAMNVFFVIDDEVVTPKLSGSILSGITRMSVLELLGSWGLKVSQRRISVDELAQTAREGRLKEAFGTGTAAVISPIGELKWNDEIMTIGGGQIGNLSQRLYDVLTGIQFGSVPDEFGWTVEV